MSEAKTSWTAAELAEACGGKLVGDGSRSVTGIRPLNEAGPEDVSYLSDPAWAKYLADTGAGLVILKEEQPTAAYAQIIAEDPYLAYAKVAGVIETGLHPREVIGVADGAVVAEDVVLGEGCSVYPTAFIGSGAKLGSNCTVHPGVCIGQDVTIGDDCEFFPNVVVYRNCRIGSRVRIHACTVIGNDGYGFAPRADRSLEKIPQMGWTEIEDDVEIGPCCTVHRGALGPTRIGRGSKLDALCLVAHNVQVGEHVRLVGQVGVSGSTEIGDRAILAGQVGTAGHLRIAPDVVVAAQSGVPGNIDKPGIYFGSPAIPMEKARRAYGTLPKLPEMRKAIKSLEKRLAKLEGSDR